MICSLSMNYSIRNRVSANSLIEFYSFDSGKQHANLDVKCYVGLWPEQKCHANHVSTVAALLCSVLLLLLLLMVVRQQEIHLVSVL